MADASSGASSGKVPVVECVVASWRFLFQNGQQFLPAALIVSVVSGVAPVLLASGGGLSVGATYSALLISNVATLFLVAAVLRKAVRSEFVGRTGLAFGQDEARLLGVLGSIVLLLLPAVVLSGIVFAFVMLGSMNLTPEQMEALSQDPAATEKAMADALAGPARGTLQILGVIGFLILLYFTARLYMVNAATVGERRIVFFQTWGWTKGNVLRVLAAMLMTLLPGLLVSLIAVSIAGGLLGNTSSPIAIAIAGTIVAFVGALANIPPVVLGAELYRGLRPPDFVAK